MVSAHCLAPAKYIGHIVTIPVDPAKPHRLLLPSQATGKLPAVGTRATDQRSLNTHSRKFKTSQGIMETIETGEMTPKCLTWINLNREECGPCIEGTEMLV